MDDEIKLLLVMQRGIALARQINEDVFSAVHKTKSGQTYAVLYTCGQRHLALVSLGRFTGNPRLSLDFTIDDAGKMAQMIMESN